MKKKRLPKLVNQKVLKKKIGQKKHIFNSHIQIQNRIKTTTSQIEKKNLLTRNEMRMEIGIHEQYEIQGM